MRFRRLWLMRLSASCLSIAFALAALEIALRAKPDLFGIALANQTFSRYGTFPGAIYFKESKTRMMFMWPDFETRAYYNGYFWHHSTDENGFRNPPQLPTRVLLLGDSLIYGHGVEGDETVAHYLRARHGVDAYDMSRQGDCLYQNYVNLRLHLRAFAPDQVVLFTFLNDFDDLEIYRSVEEITARPKIAGYDYASIRAHVKQRERRSPGRLRRLSHSIAIRRFVPAAGEVLAAAIGRLWSRPAHAKSDRFDGPLFDDTRFARTATYYDVILGDLVRRTRAVGADLALVHLDLYPPAQRAARARATNLLEGAAVANGIGFFDAGPAIRRCDACRLENDGHFTPTGNRAVADFVAQVVRSGS